MKLIIENLTIAAEGIRWYDNDDYGIAQVAGVQVRYHIVDTITTNSDPFYLGIILSEDIALLPEGYIASLTHRCRTAECGNAIDAEEDFCNDCLACITDPASEDGTLDTYREPMGVLLAEEAQREHDPIYNFEDE